MGEWRLRWKDHEWTDTDLTVADAVVVGELLGVDTWASLQPTSSPRACVAVLATLIAKTVGVTIEEAQAAVLALSLPEFVETLHIG